MPIVTLKDIHVSFGAERLFEKLDLKIYGGEKVGVVGPNGCGKTTLLKLALGSVEADIGHVRRRKGLRIGYLPQESIVSGERTVRQELHCGAEEILRLQRKMEQAAEELSDKASDELKGALARYDRAVREFDAAGGYGYKTRIREITAGLGLGESCYGLRTSELSGGQLSRLGLAKVLLSDANLLLLDEPTNHLDWEATVWVERFLKNFKGGALIVSHDRFLLDRLVSKIVEVGGGGANVYPGNYSNYKKEKEKRKLELSRQYEQRAEFIERTRDFIARNKDQEGMRKVARGRKKYLERILADDPDFLQKPDNEKKLKFEFAEVAGKSARADSVLRCRQVSKSYDGVSLFEGLSFEVFSGERLGIIGPNGTGKTTVLKLALGKAEPTSGTVEFKRNLSVGYLDQAGAELDENNCVIEEARLADPVMSVEQIRGRLGAFLFSGDDVFKKVSELSGGQRSRLALCKLVLSGPQVLVLDEPTNHLDIPSTEALERALGNYGGMIIVVSHDRFFLDRIAEKLLVIGADAFGKKAVGKFEFVIGGYSRYARLLDERIAGRNEKAGGGGRKPKRPKQKKERKKTPAELRQFNAWSDERIEEAIIETEAMIESMGERFGDEGVYKEPAAFAELQEDFEEKKRYLELLYKAYDWRSDK